MTTLRSSPPIKWGQGTCATTEALSRKGGHRLRVATIGPAGENLLPYACIINSRNHSAGAGAAAVMGSKKLKAPRRAR